MKEYKVTLSFDISILDVEKERKKEASDKLRQEAIDTHQKLLATKREAMKKLNDTNNNNK